MNQRLELTQDMRCEILQALQICGGMTQSIFPQVEAWLLNDTDHQNALLILDDKGRSKSYKSVIDFLFCELFPVYVAPCMKYYEGKGKQLKEMITARELVFYNDVLLKALELAYDLFKEERKISWRSFRAKVSKYLAA
jgi:hypothetical protein